VEAIILAGGKGTRLQPVVSNRPKPMAEVAGRPFAEWLVRALRAQGVEHVVFCTGYMSQSVESYFGDGSAWNINITYSLDPFPLGTAGAIRHALSQIDSRYFLALNGDSFCPIDVGLLEEFHDAHDASTTLQLIPMEDCRRFGTVEVNEDGSVKAFCEKSQEKRSGWINAGIYLFDQDTVSKIPCDRTVSLERELFPQWIGHGLYGFLGTGPFIDIGIPETYAVADTFLPWENLT